MTRHHSTNHTPGFWSDLLNMVDQLLKPLGAVLCLLLIICIPVDTYEFLHEPTDYIWVHHLDTSQPNWQWQYLKGNCLIFLLAVFGLTLFILSHTNWRKKQIKIIGRTFALAMIAWMGVGFYQWAIDGFDH